MTIPVEIFTTTIGQIGTFAVGVLTLIGVFVTSRQAREAKNHASSAAADARVTRSETRNSHNPEIPMRHDLDRVLGNQEQERQSNKEFQEYVRSALDVHVIALERLDNVNVEQWKAIGANEHVATRAFEAATATRSVVTAAIPTTPSA